MLKRTVIALLTVTALAASSTSVDAAPNRPASPPPTDFWQKQGFMNMAHQGGERENPGNTLFAFKKAIADGADAIDMDVTLTKDNVLVATHDSEPCHTSNAPCPGAGGATFRDLTLQQLRQFDFGYWFSPGLATYYDKSMDVPHPYRGMATGDVAPPTGYTANDFKISTFSEILDAFPNTPINVELKPYADAQATADAAAAALAAHPGREDDVIVNSFSQDMIERFHAAAPNHLALGGSLEGTLSYVTGNAITPTPVAVEPPDKYDLGGGNIVDTLPLLSPHFEYDGYISVVWPSDLDETQETDPWYAKLIGQGADAINTMFPSRLQNYLCSNGVPRPDGKTPRCAEQECPKGQTGYAPDHCVAIPPAQAKGLRFSTKKGQIKAGKKLVMTLVIPATDGYKGTANIRLRSSNRNLKLPKLVKVNLAPNKSVTKKVTVTATKKASGKATITATTGKLVSKATLAIKPVCAKSGKRGGLCGKTNHL